MSILRRFHVYFRNILRRSYVSFEQALCLFWKGIFVERFCNTIDLLEDIPNVSVFSEQK